MTRRRWYMIGMMGAAATATTLLFAGYTGQAAAQRARNSKPAPAAAAAAESDAASDKMTPAEKYASLLADSESLTRYDIELQQLIASQQADIDSLQKQVDGLDQSAAAVEPLLQKMYDGLSKFVAQDLPFLTDERQARLDRLGAIMATDGNYFNKYRALMDAYQVELDYGRTMAAYDGKLPDGRKVHFIHLGRVSIMYQTLDGEESGYWDAANHKWTAAPKFARAITEAIKMAKEQIAADLVTVPVPAAKETGL